MAQLPASAEALFRARFETSTLPQAVLDMEGRFRLVNPAFSALLGRIPDNLLTMHPWDLNDPSDPGDADRALTDLMDGRADEAHAERIFRHAEGRPVPVRVHSSVAADSDGTRHGIVAFIHDLSDLFDVEQRLRQQQTFYRALGEQARDAGFIVDDTGMLLYVAPSARRVFGYEPEEILATAAWDYIHPDDLAQVQREFADIIANGGTARVTLRVRTGENSWRWAEATATNLLHTPIGGVVCNLVDITREYESRQRLDREQARNRGIVEAAQEGVWVVDSSGRTDYVNARMADILGLPIDLLSTTRPADLVVDVVDRVALGARIRDRAQRGPERYEVNYAHPDGAVRRLQISAAPLTFADGSFFGSVAMVSDVTVRHRLEEELRHAVLHDSLTGLPNRALLYDRLNQALITQEQQDGVVSVLLVDLDQFKLVNDSHGHEIGDQVLLEMARRIRRQVRPQDTVARHGGDEFIVLITDRDGREAERAADAIVQALRAPVELADYRVHVSASVGVACSPPHDGDGLLRYAETAMFAAKNAGRARARVFDRRLADEADATFALGHDLRAALQHDQLEMHYQPIIDLATGRPAGYEGLARWNHEQQGPVAAERFVELAERMGLSPELDSWAVRHAADDYSSLRDRDPSAPTYVAVNLSAAHLDDPELERCIVDVTSAAGVPPEDFALEITERALLEDMVRGTALLHRLRDRGHPIVIDDFGTGYSSLAYLRNFPITTIKIDRMFIADAVADSDALAIVSSIIQMAKAVGAATIAEGIETAEQATLLSRLGCTAAQGWLWAKAAPLEAVTQLPLRFPPVSAPSGAQSRPRLHGELLDNSHGLHRMLQLQREGASLTTIAAALNLEGYRTPLGQRWHKMSVARALIGFKLD